MLGARRAGGESPCRPSRASGTTTGGADHGPERRQIQRHRQFADTSSTSSFAFTCGALRSSSTFRRGQTQSVNRLSLAPASTVPGPRVLPSTSITRLHRYYDPIRHPKGPVPCLTTPPLASTACQPPQGASRVAHNPSFTHAVAITPAEPLGALIVRFPNGGGLPEIQAGRLPHCPFRGLLSVHCTLRPMRSPSPLRTLYTRSFDRFVTSTAVPIATGWNDICRVGFAPTKVVHLCTAH